jgi:hypothetical protein
MSTLCQFTAGAKKGTVRDYAPMAAIPVAGCLASTGRQHRRRHLGQTRGARWRGFPATTCSRWPSGTLAFTIAPHLQIINYHGRFWGFAGI